MKKIIAFTTIISACFIFESHCGLRDLVNNVKNSPAIQQFKNTQLGQAVGAFGKAAMNYGVATVNYKANRMAGTALSYASPLFTQLQTNINNIQTQAYSLEQQLTMEIQRLGGFIPGQPQTVPTPQYITPTQPATQPITPSVPQQPVTAQDQAYLQKYINAYQQLVALRQTLDINTIQNTITTYAASNIAQVQAYVQNTAQTSIAQAKSISQSLAETYYTNAANQLAFSVEQTSKSLTGFLNSYTEELNKKTAEINQQNANQTQYINVGQFMPAQ